VKLRKDAIDLSGERFGELTVLSPIKNGKHRGVMWLCKCDCGNDATAYGGHLRAGKRVSCGCRSQARIFETGINHLYSRYKRMAKRRGKEFSLDRIFFQDLVTSNCFYCGVEPSQMLKRNKSNKLQIKYNGVDKVDHERGYVKDNCVSCCYYCNHAKADQTLDQFRKHIARIYKWHHKSF
jgi:hypothetical protein